MIGQGCPPGAGRLDAGLRRAARMRDVAPECVADVLCVRVPPNAVPSPASPPAELRGRDVPHGLAAVLGELVTPARFRGARARLAGRCSAGLLFSPAWGSAGSQPGCPAPHCMSVCLSGLELFLLCLGDARRVMPWLGTCAGEPVFGPVGPSPGAPRHPGCWGPPPSGTFAWSGDAVTCTQGVSSAPQCTLTVPTLRVSISALHEDLAPGTASPPLAPAP